MQRRTTTSLHAAIALATMIAPITGCSKDDTGTTAPASSTSQTAATTASTAAAASTSAAPPPEPKHDCPPGSSGDGSSAKPCLASGNARMLEIAWTGKSDDDGPTFNVKSKSSLTILFGKVAFYFYDKAGKQLPAQDTSSTPPKSAPFKTCAGLLFGGAVKPDDKFVLSFSCMKKDSVPAGTAAIEVEAGTVGFADASEKKTDFYWSNPDLTPDARKKGGVK